MTALGNPKLLERVSACLVQCRALFSRFDTDNRGYITKERFRTVYHELFEADSQSEVDEVRFRQKTEEDRQRREKETEKTEEDRRLMLVKSCKCELYWFTVQSSYIRIHQYLHSPLCSLPPLLSPPILPPFLLSFSQTSTSARWGPSPTTTSTTSSGPTRSPQSPCGN